MGAGGAGKNKSKGKRQKSKMKNGEEEGGPRGSGWACRGEAPSTQSPCKKWARIGRMCDSHQA